MTTDPIDTENYLDIRDIIERFEELEDEIAQLEPDDEAEELDEDQSAELEELRDEFETLKSFLEELAGAGGGHQWRGDWYPVGLIIDSYFEDHARELAEDIGAISGSEEWPLNCIDWERAARELQMDYSIVSFQGVTYWYR